MSRVIPKSKVKPAKRLPPDRRMAQGELTAIKKDRQPTRHRISAALEEVAGPPPVLTRRQQLILVGMTAQALWAVAAEYPRRHTLDFEAAVLARFRETVQRAQHQERENGIKDGLAELAEADCRMILTLV